MEALEVCLGELGDSPEIGEIFVFSCAFSTIYLDVCYCLVTAFTGIESRNH